MASSTFNVFVGAETGLFKGIDCVKGKWENLNSESQVDRNKEVNVMCWGNKEETEVCLGLKDQKVIVYNTEQKTFVQEYSFHGGEGMFQGLAKHDSLFLTCVESGLIKLWNSKDEEKLEIDAGKDLCCMSQNKQKSHIIGSGGKENGLKLWDLNKPSRPFFRAKNVCNDWLDLRVPVWVIGIDFIPDTDKVVTGTGYHQIRVYDPSTPQRRPVLSMEFDEYPLTALSVRPGNHQVVIGNTQGFMAMMDLRKGQLIHSFKGFSGGIKNICCHSSLPYVASCGLDRYLRIHHIDTKQLLYKFYMKSRLNCLLFTSEWPEQSGKECTKRKTETAASEDFGNGYRSDGDDAVWDMIPILKTKSAKNLEASKKQNSAQISDKKIKIKRKKSNF